MNAANDFDDMTLDPPGTICVAGAGPLGLEAALYGRFLGYKVTVFDSGEHVAQSLRGRRDLPLPFSPADCLSRLAQGAIDAQFDPPPSTQPMTVGEWIDRKIEPLSKTDLLRDQIRLGNAVAKIDWVQSDENLTDTSTEETKQGTNDSQSPPANCDADDESTKGTDAFEIVGDVPPDFAVHLNSGDDAEPLLHAGDFEAVILTRGQHDAIQLPGEPPLDYLFIIDADVMANGGRDAGLRQIRDCYARLAGRRELDLYAPLRR